MKKYILLFTTFLFLTFCNNFDELNINPNDPSSDDIPPRRILGRILKQSTLTFHLHQRIHNLYADQFSQYYMAPRYSTYEYRSIDSWITDYWNEHYGWFHNLGKLLEEPETGNFTINDKQLVRIWRVWITHRAVDLMGDIPYFNNEGVYDSEENIYKDMLDELEDAASMFDDQKDIYTDQFTLKYDNVNLWKKFANSLRLRLAMRLTNVDSDLAKNHAEGAVKGGVLELNEETPYMPPSGVWGEGYSYYMYLGWGGNGLVLSKNADDIMQGIGGIGFNKNDVDSVKYGKYPEVIDPRATIIFNSTSKYSDIEEELKYRSIWSSVPMGLSVEDKNSLEYQDHNNSRINKTLQNPNRDFTVMPVAEVWFLRAEGATYGWDMDVSTKDAYEKGVKTSFEYWGLEESLANTYLASKEQNNYNISANWEDVNGGGALEKIITQKYIGGYPDNSFEAWADLRRLELPEMDFGSQFNTSVPAGKVIQRVRYPSVQAILNAENYSQVSANDNEGRKHWWSKQD